MPDITAIGASLVAMTPELPDYSLSTVEKHQLTFDSIIKFFVLDGLPS